MVFKMRSDGHDYSIWLCFTRSRRANSHPSRASESDHDPFTIHDHRDQTFTTADREHFIQVILILNDIPVVDRAPIALKCLTGIDCVGSGEFTVNNDGVHGKASLAV
jgi:hypothetical protein